MHAGPVSSLLEGLKGEEMPKGVNTVTGDTTTQERKSQTVPYLQDHKPDQPSQQGYAPSDPQPESNLKAKAEELLAEEQAGFRAGLNAVEHIFNCRVLIEKHLQHQRDLLHNFVDLKKAFDRL